MGLTLIATVTTRLKALLLAGPRTNPYGGAAGELSTFPSDPEFTEAGIEGDADVCRAIVETVGHPSAALFMVASPNLASGTIIPDNVGAVGDVLVDGVLSNLAESRSEILEIRSNAALYPNAGKWHFIEGGVLYHTGTNGVVYTPRFSKTNACQSPDIYTGAVVAAGMRYLMKDGADPNFFQYYANLFARQEAEIRGRQLVIPELVQYEKAAA